MPPSNDSVDDITISLGEGGERSPHHDKRMYKAQRNNSQHLPLEDQSHLPREKSKSYSSKLSLRSILYNPFTFRDSMKRAGSSNRMEMIREGSVKSNDEELVESFRKMLQEDGQLPLKHSDSHTLLRFLRMRAYDFTKAKEMYLKMLKWRDEHAVDTILKEFQFEEYLEVKKCYPHGFHGVDIYGRPLYIERIGMVDLNRLLEVTTIDRFAKYHISEQEKTLNLRYPACSIAANKHVASTTSILDVKGVGMNNFSKPAREIFMEIQKIDSNNYPETLHQLFIVNAGSGFRVLWKALKAFLEPRTLAKIQVLGSNFQNNLLEIIDPSTLPSFLGGHCTCPEFGGCLLNDKGPWNDPEITDALRANFERKTNISKKGNSSMRSSIATNPNMVPSFDEHVSNKFQGLQERLEEIKNIMATVVGKQEDITRQIEELKKLGFFVPKPKP